MLSPLHELFHLITPVALSQVLPSLAFDYETPGACFYENLVQAIIPYLLQGYNYSTGNLCSSLEIFP